MSNERLAGHIFRNRCNEVDAGRARGSWCARAKLLLQRDPSFHSVWRLRSPLRRWKDRILHSCHDHYTAMSDHEITTRRSGSLDVFCLLGPSESGDLLRSSLRHRGAEVRFKLRAGALPLMWTVAAGRQDLGWIEPENRCCLLCPTLEVDNARHFLCSCPVFEEERYSCLGLINQALGDAAAPNLRSAMLTTEGCFSLFLITRYLNLSSVTSCLGSYSLTFAARWTISSVTS
jgi:hypothetical protein